MTGLSIVDDIPDGLLTTPARQLFQVLEGPTLIHLPGRRERPLFVSVLLHGNEDVGVVAVQRVLSEYRDRPLPRAMSIFIGNVAAARQGLRCLPGQPDYNRIWPGGRRERDMMGQVVEQMRGRRVFASVDLHNNTGHNPLYGCVNRLENRFLRFASMFSRTVVYFVRPRGVQSMAFAGLCPAVTLECGKVGDARGIARAAEFIEDCLALAEIPDAPAAAADIDLFHTIAVVKVPPEVTLAFDGRGDADLSFSDGLEYYNFTELPAGTRLARVGGGRRAWLDIRDEDGRDVGDQFLDCRAGELRLRRPVVPAMLTTHEAVIREDCLCYLMERLPLPAG